MSLEDFEKLRELLDQLLDIDSPKAYRDEIRNIITYVEGQIEKY